MHLPSPDSKEPGSGMCVARVRHQDHGPVFDLDDGTTDGWCSGKAPFVGRIEMK